MVCAQAGKNEVGNTALLTKMSGKNSTPEIAEMVSVFLLFIPITRKIPDSANSKNAAVSKISSIPGTPEEIVTPIATATTIVMTDWTITTKTSVNNLPSKIAGLLT